MIMINWLNNILFTSVVLSTTCMMSIFYVHKRRLAFNKNERHALIANKLLTRHPLVFFSGVKSLFFASNHWNELPFWLEQHGYQVLEINTPKSEFLNSWLEIFFSQIPGRIHLTIPAEQIESFLPLLKPYKNKIESLSFNYHWLGNKLNETKKNEFKKMTERTLNLATHLMWSLHRQAIQKTQSKDKTSQKPTAWMLNEEQRKTSLYYAQSLAEQDFIDKENKSLHRVSPSSNLEA